MFIVWIFLAAFILQKYSVTSQVERQMVRWKRIALEASKQCGRQFPPKIYWHSNLETSFVCTSGMSKFMGTFPRIGLILFPGIIAPVQAEQNQRSTSGCWLVRKEGFILRRLIWRFSSGMHQVDLGPRILRTETAAMTAVAILQFLWGDLSQNNIGFAEKVIYLSSLTCSGNQMPAKVENKIFCKPPWIPGLRCALPGKTKKKHHQLKIGVKKCIK